VHARSECKFLFERVKQTHNQVGMRMGSCGIVTEMWSKLELDKARMIHMIYRAGSTFPSFEINNQSTTVNDFM
jgi:hypothetical protein